MSLLCNLAREIVSFAIATISFIFSIFAVDDQTHFNNIPSCIFFRVICPETGRQTIRFSLRRNRWLCLTGKPAHKADSVKATRILRQWTLSPDYSEEVNSPIDTVFSLFNRFRIADKYSPVNATLGNYGLPFYQISFFDRITDPDKFLYTHLLPFHVRS